MRNQHRETFYAVYHVVKKQLRLERKYNLELFSSMKTALKNSIQSFIDEWRRLTFTSNTSTVTDMLLLIDTLRSRLSRTHLINLMTILEKIGIGNNVNTITVHEMMNHKLLQYFRQLKLCKSQTKRKACLDGELTRASNRIQKAVRRMIKFLCIMFVNYTDESKLEEYELSKVKTRNKNIFVIHHSNGHQYLLDFPTAFRLCFTPKRSYQDVLRITIVRLILTILIVQDMYETYQSIVRETQYHKLLDVSSNDQLRKDSENKDSEDLLTKAEKEVIPILENIHVKKLVIDKKEFLRLFYGEDSNEMKQFEREIESKNAKHKKEGLQKQREHYLAALSAIEQEVEKLSLQSSIQTELKLEEDPKNAKYWFDTTEGLIIPISY